jgi:hypothetical protein
MWVEVEPRELFRHLRCSGAQSGDNMNAAPVFWYQVWYRAVSVSRMDGSRGWGALLCDLRGFFLLSPRNHHHKVRTVLIDGDQRFQRKSYCELVRVFYSHFPMSEPKVDKYDPWRL